MPCFNCIMWPDISWRLSAFDYVFVIHLILKVIRADPPEKDLDRKCLNAGHS